LLKASSPCRCADLHWLVLVTMMKIFVLAV
jgi:hypothetical protein